MNENLFSEIESQVSTRAGSYPGLLQEALLTSEADFRAIFESIPGISTFVELGCGYGEGVLLFAKLHPNSVGIGVEFEKPRFDTAQDLRKKLNVTNARFFHADLLTAEIPHGDTYFLYFPTGIVLDRILSELKKRKDLFKLVVIESHGDMFPRLEKESWLKKTQSIKLHSVRHDPYALVFTNLGEAQDSLHEVSFKKQYLWIEDANQDQWIGESYGLEWNFGNQYQLLTPPRTISEDQVKKRSLLSEIPQEFHPALELRRLGELRIETRERVYLGSLRKIFVSPSFKVEISSGEQVEWSEVTKIFWGRTLCLDSCLGFYSFPLVDLA